MSNGLKNVAEALNELYENREKIPEFMDRLNTFAKKCVMQDLIDLGCRVNQVKKHHSAKLAVISIFLPRTVANFTKFDKEMTEFLDGEEEVEIKPKINGKKSKKKSKENYFGLDQNVFAPSRD